ncbi:MAG TPA: hypothetical protein HPP77_06680 [Candidatus Hydrogenedentes bacterium]|nr:hypothetical protein [Candidatus Hydrogenedentota bacterium]HIJ73938.1 hypothetical protein [Candidatus Hydrogenedentota bacterium]
MKSAYELAMARLEKSHGPAKKLSDAQRKRIADIDAKYEARVAEQKLAYESKIAAAGSAEERNTVQSELADKLRSLEAGREKEKDAVWESED